MNGAAHDLSLSTSQYVVTNNRNNTLRPMSTLSGTILSYFECKMMLKKKERERKKENRKRERNEAWEKGYKRRPKKVMDHQHGVPEVTGYFQKKEHQ